MPTKEKTKPVGMMFARIRQTILKIPRSKVSTYGDVARAAGFPGAARQVSWALASSRGLPWQRVVGAKGRILLAVEAGAEQRLRLEMEDVRFINGRVDMKQHGFVFLRAKKKKSSTR